MMTITIQLFGALRNNRFEEEVRDVPPEWGVKDLMASLHIPPHFPVMILLNGTHVKSDASLNNGDILSLTPVLAGG